jgi:hypothetical protein
VAIGVERAEVAHRQREVLAGGLLVPIGGLDLVRSDAKTMVKERAERVLGLGVALLGERLPFLIGGAKVAGLIGGHTRIVVGEGRPSESRADASPYARYKHQCAH